MFAERLRTAVVEPILFNGKEIQVAASVGVALAPEHCATPERLMKSADLARYRSKAGGRNCVRFFQP